MSKRYAIVIERAGENWSAYVPDLVGVVSVGDTPEECEANIQSAIELYFEEVEQEVEPVTRVSYVQVA